MDEPTIHELYRKVREHPDYVFGAIFVRDDFDGDVPENAYNHVTEDLLAEYGSNLIENL